MNNEIHGFEKKRAQNLVWSAAGTEDFNPPVLIYDSDEKADLYWNSMIGAAYKHFEWDVLEQFYLSFQGDKYQLEKENIFWIALQHAAYYAEANDRPVLPYLRNTYVRRTVSDMNFEKAYINKDDTLSYRILRGYIQRYIDTDTEQALDKKTFLHPDDREEDIINAVEIPGGFSTEQIIDRLRSIFDRYFTGKKRMFHFKWNVPSLTRKMAFGNVEHVFESKEDADIQDIPLGVAEENYRKYLSNYFGLPMYEETELKNLERDLCSGEDTGCRLYFTTGEYAEHMENGRFVTINNRSGEKNALTNQKEYERHKQKYARIINELTGRIKNSMLVHLEDQVVRSVSGRLDVGRIWRGIYIDEKKLFNKKLPGDNGNITVDILIDASDSQTPRKTLIAAQSYILAESLTRCGIPVRISSFCSLNGYTVMTVYRGYDEPEKNIRVFRYFTAGCNRDGLGLRMLCDMIKDNPVEHKLLIALSDCKPQDSARLKGKDGVFVEYKGESAVDATARSVRMAKAHGIMPMCIFTGADSEVPNATRIYDKNFVRIHDLNRMADTVGNLLTSVIGSMDVSGN